MLRHESRLSQQNAIVSSAQTTQTPLQGIDSVLGTPGSGSDIGSRLSNLQDSFSSDQIAALKPGNQSTAEAGGIACGSGC